MSNDNIEIITGDLLKSKIANSIRPKWRTRGLLGKLTAFVYGTSLNKVGVLCGLRRTGKSTMMLQTIARMSDEDFNKTAFIQVQDGNTMAELHRTLKECSKKGYKYIFIDEVTKADRFLSSASMFPDTFAQLGMRIVLSGTDSLGFIMADIDELLNRNKQILTTRIPVSEYISLMHINDIDLYLKGGGVLYDITDDDNPFSSIVNANKWVVSSLGDNIEHTLVNYKGGKRFGNLAYLHGRGIFPEAVQKIVQDINHKFLLTTLTDQFKSADIGSAIDLMIKNKQEILLDEYVDVQYVTQELKKQLNIYDDSQMQLGITQDHIDELKDYLFELDVLEEVKVENYAGRKKPKISSKTLFALPGLRWAQVGALLEILKEQPGLRNLKSAKSIFTNIENDVLGRMLEELVLIETIRELPPHFYVCQAILKSGEVDMIVYNKDENWHKAYEIKHDHKMDVKNQAKHLLNSDNIILLEKYFGENREKCVLYRGKNILSCNGIRYRNVTDFLKNITECISEPKRTPHPPDEPVLAIKCGMGGSQFFKEVPELENLREVVKDILGMALPKFEEGTLNKVADIKTGSEETVSDDTQLNHSELKP